MSSSNNATTPPTIHRPLYDGCDGDQDKMVAAMMKEMTNLQTVDQDDPLDFAAKTSQWVAYERAVESSARDADTALFHDPLAQHFVGKYGQRMSDAFALGLQNVIFDDPADKDEPKLGIDGHLHYTAARTKLINDYIERWLNMPGIAKTKYPKKQVVNVGAGLDTRVYWLDCLEEADCDCSYWEIDQESVVSYKQAVLDRLEREDNLPALKCKRHVISMDFAKQSLDDALLATDGGGFDPAVPTFWILEGIIMYLSKQDTIDLMDTISKLSAPASYAMINFANNDRQGPTMDELSQHLQDDSGWTERTTRLMFGDDGFNFGRYPDGKAPNKFVGFAMFEKNAQGEGDNGK